jgi:predicted transcriptional regulator
MEVHFTHEQEERLLKIATHEGIDPAQLPKEAALRLLEDDTRFRNAVRQGIRQGDQGQLIEEDEMDARVRRLFPS